jgi:hypothetical protein
MLKDWVYSLAYEAPVSNWLGASMPLQDRAAKVSRMASQSSTGWRKFDPGNTAWQGELSRSFINIGVALTAQGDLSGALENYGNGLAILDELPNPIPPAPNTFTGWRCYSSRSQPSSDSRTRMRWCCRPRV